jgi:hypothetical protein
VDFSNIGEFGAAGAILLVMWKLLDLLVNVMRGRNKETLNMTPLACQEDPRHYQHIRENHGMLQEVLTFTSSANKKMDQGAYSCAWQGRDEIRDFRDSITELTSETKLLRYEMVKQRNGSKQ